MLFSVNIISPIPQEKPPFFSEPQKEGGAFPEVLRSQKFSRLRRDFWQFYYVFRRMFAVFLSENRCCCCFSFKIFAPAALWLRFQDAKTAESVDRESHWNWSELCRFQTAWDCWKWWEFEMSAPQARFFSKTALKIGVFQWKTLVSEAFQSVSNSKNKPKSENFRGFRKSPPLLFKTSKRRGGFSCGIGLMYLGWISASSW